MIRAVVTDLDRTLTDEALVPAASALTAVEALRGAGFRVVLATGRSLEHVNEARLDRRFDAVVAENGAVVQAAGGEPVLRHVGFASAARDALATLAAPVRWGRVMGSASRRQSANISRRLLRRNVPHALIANADEVMILPPGVHKGSGAVLALAALGLRPTEAAGIGDSWNDLDLFDAVTKSVAVANAPAAVRRRASLTTRAAFADGFVEFADRLLETAQPPRFAEGHAW